MSRPVRLPLLVPLLLALGCGKHEVARHDPPPPADARPHTPPPPVTLRGLTVRVVQKALWIEAEATATRALDEDTGLLVEARCQVGDRVYADLDTVVLLGNDDRLRVDRPMHVEASLFETLIGHAADAATVERCQLSVHLFLLGSVDDSLGDWCWSARDGLHDGACPTTLVDPVPTAAAGVTARVDRVQVTPADLHDPQEPGLRVDVAFDYTPIASPPPSLQVMIVACDVGGVTYADPLTIDEHVPLGATRRIDWEFFDPRRLPAPPTRCELFVRDAGRFCADLAASPATATATPGACADLQHPPPAELALDHVTLTLLTVGIPERQVADISLVATRPASWPDREHLHATVTCLDGRAWTAPEQREFAFDLAEVESGEAVYDGFFWETGGAVLVCDLTLAGQRFCLRPGGHTDRGPCKR